MDALSVRLDFVLVDADNKNLDKSIVMMEPVIVGGLVSGKRVGGITAL